MSKKVTLTISWQRVRYKWHGFSGQSIKDTVARECCGGSEAEMILTFTEFFLPFPCTFKVGSVVPEIPICQFYQPNI